MMLATNAPATDTCPHCADDLDRDRCSTCAGTGQVEVCCGGAETETIYPAVDSDDWILRCLAHGCSVCGVVHGNGARCVSGGV